MPANTVEILIRINDAASAPARQIAEALQRIDNSTRQTVAGATALDSSFSRLTRTLLGLTAAVGGLYTVQGAIKGGVAAAEEFRLRTIGIAAALTNLAETGQGSYAQVFRRNLQYAQQFYDELRKYDAQHAASIEDMLTLYDAFVQKGYQVRRDEAESLAVLADRIKLATQGQNYQIQAYQEIRALLDGQANAHSLIAQELRNRLGPAWADILQQHREAGTLVKYLASLFPGVSAAAREYEDTLEAQKTTLISQLKYIGREGLAGLWQDILETLQGINRWLRDNEQIIIRTMQSLYGRTKGTGALGLPEDLWGVARELQEAANLQRQLAGRAITPIAEIEAIARARMALRRFAEQSVGRIPPVTEDAIKLQRELANQIREWSIQLQAGPGNEIITWYETLSLKIERLLDKLREVPQLQRDVLYWEQQLSNLRSQLLSQQQQLLDLEYRRWQATKIPGPVGIMRRIELEYEEIRRKYGQRLVETGGLGQAAVRIPEAMRPIFVRAAQEYRVPLNVLAAVAAAESGFRQEARSRAGAIGVMQLMPSTARELGVEPTDLVQNIMGGAKYLSQLLGQLGSLDKAIAAYNWGIRNVVTKGLAAAPPETLRYLERVKQLAGEIGQSYQMVADQTRLQEIEQARIHEIEQARQQLAISYSDLLQRQYDLLAQLTPNYAEQQQYLQQALKLEQNIARIKLEQQITALGLNEEEAKGLRALQARIERLQQEQQLRRQAQLQLEGLGEAATAYRALMTAEVLPYERRRLAAEAYVQIQTEVIERNLQQIRERYSGVLSESIINAIRESHQIALQSEVARSLGSLAWAWQSAWTRAAENVQDALANMLYGLLTQARNTRQVLQTLVSGFLQILSQMASQAIMSMARIGLSNLTGNMTGLGLGGLLSGLSGLISGGGRVALGGAIPTFGGSTPVFNWGLPRLQHGGIVTRPTVALIGEAGPEAVVPLDKARPLQTQPLEVNVVNVYDPAEIRRLVLATMGSQEGRYLILNTISLEHTTGGGVTRINRRFG